ncbi:HNH endonuclease [Alkalibacter saccharofermentans]|uniref:HNH endonuclease n=1 Tax=Alkalibacter saccharofermentans DSM 14828 TaxID=1120975 RepID=A0A1M4ZIP2_9FIRM|nr:HNH endonuclease [Alkalibacter saccharofermentans]SHF17930.1 HNH endonuclease [Alkalibacter saccharofermentans DSM 14828]
MGYEAWYNEINSTKINRQHGQVKIYKLILLICMLSRGKSKWFMPVKAEEVALDFYRYLTDNTEIRDLSFGDSGKRKYFDFFDKKYIIHLIESNPMKYWGGSSLYGHARFDGEYFWIDIDIKSKDCTIVYEMTKELCIRRIEYETGIPFDSRVDLQDEYKYLVSETEKLGIKETEKEFIIKGRIGQEKFRNRLLERYDRCMLCGVRNYSLLIASHIKPWKDSLDFEKIDTDNGFILCPNHDKLFDKGLLTFKDSGTSMISKKLHGDIDKLNVDRRIIYELSDGNKRYLDWHRNIVFERE